MSVGSGFGPSSRVVNSFQLNKGIALVGFESPAVLRSMGQTQQPPDEFGQLVSNTRLSEEPVGCNQRPGIEEEQSRTERRSFGVGFLGLVAYCVLFTCFYVCNGSLCVVLSTVSMV